MLNLSTDHRTADGSDAKHILELFKSCEKNPEIYM